MGPVWAKRTAFCRVSVIVNEFSNEEKRLLIDIDVNKYSIWPI